MSATAMPGRAVGEFLECAALVAITSALLSDESLRELLGCALVVTTYFGLHLDYSSGHWVISELVNRALR